MLNAFLSFWQPDLVSMSASALAALVALAGVLMSVNVFRHEGSVGNIAPQRRTLAVLLVAGSVVAGGVGVVSANFAATWVSLFALGAIAVTSLFLYERNNTSDLIRRFGFRLLFGAIVSALGLVIMKFDPFQFTPSTLAMQTGFILVFLGYGVALGIAPMHTGLSEMYSKIPSPVAALVAPLSLLVGVVGILRMRGVVDGIVADGGLWTGTVLSTFGAITVVVMAGTMLRRDNYKKFFAEIGMFHTGVVVASAGFGIAGTIPALMHMSVVVLMTSALFGLAGMLHATYKTTKFSGVRQLFLLLPAPSILLTIILLGAIGVPVSGMFMSLLISIGYGLQFHLALTAVLLLSWIVVVTAVTRHLFVLTRAAHDEALALQPVRWRISLAVLGAECLALLAAVWFMGSQQGIPFFVNVAEVVSTF